ncbi:MAG: hypothetical protein CVU38_11830 [Chloroflexi bacterium HGW-Chloroflexi-1]|nr:MAG: hypothetical protein CVU38_11830 [Chloroflexi bacterium HGW-Chloroflexi-1]
MTDQASNFIPWLLAAAIPSIRYLTLRRLLGRAAADAEVQAVRQEMAATGPIPAILAGQTERGNWAGEHSFYTPKYVSTHWSMTLLAELAADGQDERLRRGAEFMLADTEAGVRKKGHYDLLWYLSDPQWPSPNLTLLDNALRQTGWPGPGLTEDTWRETVRERLPGLTWGQVAADVRPFLEPGVDARGC